MGLYSPSVAVLTEARELVDTAVATQELTLHVCNIEKFLLVSISLGESEVKGYNSVVLKRRILFSVVGDDAASGGHHWVKVIVLHEARGHGQGGDRVCCTSGRRAGERRPS